MKVKSNSAVLQQQRPGDSAWCPLGFFSKKLSPAQEKWSVFDRELWACFSGIRHFRFILEGCSFTIFTYHKPLTYALSRSTDAWTAKQCRQLSYLAEFTSDIQHMPGKENVVADALSRPSSSSSRPLADSPGLITGASSSPTDVDWHAIALRQATCPDVQAAISSTSLQVEELLHEEWSCFVTYQQATSGLFFHRLRGMQCSWLYTALPIPARRPCAG